MSKHSFPKRAIHLDFHTMPGVYDVGSDFKADNFAKTLKDAGVDYITVFARCNLGFAYYPTRIGIIHPGLKTDLLGQMVSACHKHGIRVAAYFNAGLDHEHSARHREWCKVDKEGRVYNYQLTREQEWSNFFRVNCLNTSYADYLLEMAGEVLDRYPVDGLFFDCFNLSPCYGIECLEGMKKLGLDAADEEKAKKFCWIVTEDFCRKADELVKSKKKKIFLYFNGMPYRLQPTHIEIEILPTGEWGYDCLPAIIRYARTLNKPFFTMTGRFHKTWGDFGGLRPEHSLLFDCYNSIANGGTCSVGDHMHPRGKLEPEVYRLIGSVYAKTKELDPWTEEAKALSEITVVDPAIGDYPQVPLDDLDNVRGATRMLSELKYQFDVSDGDGDLSGYRVIILPDSVLLSGKLKEKIAGHLKRGGAIISSSYAGMDAEKTGFALKDYALSYEGPEPYNYTFFRAGPEVCKDIPEMPVTIYSPGISMKGKNGSAVLAKLYKPYFNRKSWDRYHENLYIPPEKDSGRPALVRCGNIFHFSFPIFTGYFEDAVIHYKTLVRNCLSKVLPQPLVKTENFPSFGQVTVTRQDKRRMVHLLTYLPELRGRAIQIIEEPIKIGRVTLALRTDGGKISKVYLAPSREELKFKQNNNYATVTVPEVNGYQMVVFELN